MGLIKGYKYQTETEAEHARQLAADYYALPISTVSTTVYYVDYEYSELDDFYYIIWVDGCTEVLGEPIEFEIKNALHFPT
jgi:hypothetical protein